MNNNVPIQSLIDHIKTATDVDPWAKKMVEELLKEQEPITCSNCANWIPGKGTDDFHFIPPGCKRHGGMWPGDGFCSYAEKK